MGIKTIRKHLSQLYIQVLIGIVAGIVLGHQAAGLAEFSILRFGSSSRVADPDHQTLRLKGFPTDSLSIIKLT